MHKKLLIPLIISCAILISCGDGKPFGTLSDKEMEAVLWDVAQGSEFQNSYISIQYPTLNRALVSNTLLDEILKAHKTSKKSFNKSITYYEAHPDKLKIIIDTIIARRNRANVTAAQQKDSANTPTPMPVTSPQTGRPAQPAPTPPTGRRPATNRNLNAE